MKYYVFIFIKNNIVLILFFIFRKIFYKFIKEILFNFYFRFSKCKFFLINVVLVVFIIFYYICYCESFLLTFIFNINFFSRELVSLYNYYNIN